MPHGNCKLSHVSLKLDGLLAYKVQATHTHTHIYMRNDMSITILQQILSGRLLLVVIVELKK